MSTKGHVRWNADVMSNEKVQSPHSIDISVAAAHVIFAEMFRKA
jgi:hypothetical protein